MSYLWMTPGEEDRLLDEVKHRRRALQITRARISPATVAQASVYADAYPWMDASTTSAFLQAGVPADDPRIQQAAALAAEDIPSENHMDDAPDAWWESLLDNVGRPVKAVSRGVFTGLAGLYEEGQALFSALGEAAVTSDQDFSDGISIGEMIADLGNFGEDVQRFWDNYTNKAAPSAARLAIADLIQGNEVDLGEGFLPGSYSEATRQSEGFSGGIYAERERMKHRLELDGTFITPGRLIARDIVEPGTKPYTFVSGAADFAAALWLDPAIKVSAGLSKARQANRAFQTFGLIPGTRKTVAPQKAVQHYLTSGLGQRMKRWMTETTDARQIWEATGRADLQLAKRIADAADETTVHNILTDALGTVIREKPTATWTSRQIGRIAGAGSDYGSLFGGGAVIKKGMNARNVRMFRDMPGNVIPLADVDEAAVQLEAWMRNAKLGDEAIGAALDRVATEVPQFGGTAMYRIVEDVMSETAGVLVNDWGLSQQRARKVTKMWENMVRDHRTFQSDDLGREIDALAPLKVHLDGKTVNIDNGRGIVADMIGTSIPLPDARELRRLTPTVRQMQRLYDSGLWKGSMDFLDAMMSTVWKPLQLLRFAYTTRVIGEEQLRMGAAGFDSLASSPMAAIATMVGAEPSSRLAQRIAKAAENVGDLMGKATATARRVTAAPIADDVATDWARYVSTLKGEEFTDELREFQAAMSRGSAGHRGRPGEILSGKWTKVQYGEDSFFQGWAERLARTHHDPVMRRVAGGLSAGDLKSMDNFTSTNNFDDVAEWFWRGSGKKFREELAVSIGDELGNVLLHNRQAADDYLRHNFFDQLDRLTAGNSDLVSLVAQGKLGDDISVKQFGAERKLSKVLSDSYDEAGQQVRFVPMEERVAVKSAALRTADRLDQAIEHAFGFLMSKPTNYLSRSPAFRQMYWQRVDELIGFADEATQHAMIRAAKEANVADDLFESMVSKAARGGTGDVLKSIDDADILAKSFALDGTKNLLYDLGKRSQFFDMMRIVFPFGEAWKEILTSWGRIIYQNPQVARRAQQVIHAGRGGDQDPTTGFFHTDPQTGDEVFTYPDFGLLSKVAGFGDTARVSPVGRVAGLNIAATTVLPGFGPAIQLPVQWFVPRKPDLDWLHEAVSPFGTQPGDSPGQQIAAAFTPAWLEKVQTALFDDPESDRLFANTVMDVMRGLHRSGRYPINSEADLQKLQDTAADKARLLYFIRGIAQAGVPTGPSFTWETTDVEGNFVPVKILSDELRRMTDEEYGGDRNAAFLEWTRRFGIENVLAIQAKSQELTDRPVTEQGDSWLRANPDLERTYPTTVGLFAPEPAVGQFDYDAYLRAFDTGARQGLNPDEMLRLANDFLGRVEYEQAKRFAELRPGPQTAAWLAQVRADIAQRRPGFDGWVADRVRAQRPAVDQQIAEIRNAVTDPRIAQTDAGRGTIKYLSAIEVANKMVAGLGGNVRRYNTAKAALPIRQFLRSTAEQIKAEHPDFARVWTSVFERELSDDTELLLGR